MICRSLSGETARISVPARPPISIYSSYTSVRRLFFPQLLILTPPVSVPKFVDFGGKRHPMVDNFPLSL